MKLGLQSPVPILADRSSFHSISDANAKHRTRDAPCQTNSQPRTVEFRSTSTQTMSTNCVSNVKSGSRDVGTAMTFDFNDDEWHVDEDQLSDSDFSSEELSEAGDETESTKAFRCEGYQATKNMLVRVANGLWPLDEQS